MWGRRLRRENSEAPGAQASVLREQAAERVDAALAHVAAQQQDVERVGEAELAHRGEDVRGDRAVGALRCPRAAISSHASDARHGA